MQLINAIITTPEDLDFRLHLRNEFLRTGLLDILPVRNTLCKSDIARTSKVIPKVMFPFAD